MIPYGKQCIDPADIEAVVEVLNSSWLTQGPKVQEFEQALKAYCSADHVIAVANGTAALHVACLALGLSSGDWLWTSANSFAASANCARYCGAKVDFVDIDPSTHNMCLTLLAEKLERAERNGVLPKIVVPVHFAGLPCDMAAIRQLSHRYGFAVLEDAAHALGSDYQEQKIGACKYSDACVFSFHPVKNITSAEGGAISTGDSDVASKLRLYSNHGVERQPENFLLSDTPPWRYEQQVLGYNYRLSDIHAALGVSQLAKLDDFVLARNKHVCRYLSLFEPVQGLECQPYQSGVAWHLFVVEVAVDQRDRIFKVLRDNNIMVNVHYYPISLQPYYRRFGYSEGHFPNAERYARQAISLPLYVDLSEAEQDKVIALVREAIQ